MKFEVNHLAKPQIKKPFLISGLPGIGNVGKIAVDFMIEQLKAQPIIEIYSHQFPHAVFVNDKNLIDLPTIKIFHKKVKKYDLLFLAGDVQPIDEPSCYEFCEIVIETFKKLGGEEIITIGGIGLAKIPKKPKVYITGTTKKAVQSYKGCEKEIYGVVGPIIGVAGILLGLAGRKKIPAVSLLAQTFNHPGYLGIKGAREVLQIVANRFGIKLNIGKLDKEIEGMESELKAKTQQMLQKSEGTEILPLPKKEHLNYFG